MWINIYKWVYKFSLTQLLFYLMIVIGIKVIIYIFLKVIFFPRII